MPLTCFGNIHIAIGKHISLGYYPNHAESLLVQRSPKRGYIMHYYNDGNTIRKGDSYCGVRALVIATGMGWKDAEKLLKGFVSNPLSRGIYKEEYTAALASIGWHWIAAPKFEGRKARAHDLPAGTYIASQAKHYVCVIDGDCHDTFDSTEKMVYGYWAKAA